MDATDSSIQDQTAPGGGAVSGGSAGIHMVEESVEGKFRPPFQSMLVLQPPTF